MGPGVYKRRALFNAAMLFKGSGLRAQAKAVYAFNGVANYSVHLVVDPLL